MSKLGQQFSELRNSTPKYVQWLLLGAAFIVVLILLTLLLTGPKTKSTKSKNVEESPIVIKVVTIDESKPLDQQENPINRIDWANVIVGESKNEKITVKTNAPTLVSMTQNTNVPGFTAQTTCTDAMPINAKLVCNIYLKYEPQTVMETQTVTLSVNWRAEGEPKSMNTTEKITVVLGAIAPAVKPTAKPEPIVEPEPIIEDDYDDEYEDYIESEPTIREEIESIAPSFSFDEDTAFEPEPAPVALPSVASPAPVVERPSELCSDFAFPGYGANGNQIGWIKPERGGYYFHPFSDRDCKKPTGIYNPASGLITDINGGGNRIGTDAEHIGYAATNMGTLPTLSPSPRSTRNAGINTTINENMPIESMGKIELKTAPTPDVEYDTTDDNAVVSTQPYDRTFILRQYKPIPATIVSDVRADTALDEDNNMRFPVRATVDRNVYSDNGRTIIIPTGTLLLGYVSGEVPGPYKAIGRMNIKWYQFVLPNGVEFNFGTGQFPVSADSQGRIGVPGRGSTDYLEQFVMPMLTAIVPATVNMIAPVADKFVNQIDLDNNTVVQSGTMRSSELAKNEIITAWNQVAQKLLVDMMDNTVPPFTIPAGTRITVYSPNDLMVVCNDPSKKCHMENTKHAANTTRTNPEWDVHEANDGSWVGQARSFDLEQYCTQINGVWDVDKTRATEITQKSGYSYSTVLGYCKSLNYKAINNARQEAVYQNQQQTFTDKYAQTTDAKGNSTYNVNNKSYNEQVLGLKYNEDGSIKDPYKKEPAPAAATQQSNDIITCDGGIAPDPNGCCPGEEYTDMGDQGFNCCPVAGGDCFPPITQ